MMQDLAKWYDKVHTPTKVTISESSVGLGRIDHYGGADLLYWWTKVDHAEARESRVSFICIDRAVFSKDAVSGYTTGLGQDVLRDHDYVYVERTHYGQFIDLDSRTAICSARMVIFCPEGIRAIEPKTKQTQTEISLL
jgi:hypothetical protein